MDLDSDAQTSAKAALLAPLCTVLPLDQGFHIIGNPEIQDSVDIYLWEYSYAVTGTTYTASAGVLLDSDPQSGSGASCVSKSLVVEDKQDE